MKEFRIGDIIEGTGTRRDIGVIVELSEDKMRARISWTHKAEYVCEIGSNNRCTTSYTGKFTLFSKPQPRTWMKVTFLKLSERF